jgi:FKBP-type peptidyl-prolyl cis-trans isomerase
MKKLFILSAVLNILVVSIYGQAKTTTVSKSAPSTTPSFKNLSDSFSYALGIQVANYYKQQGIKSINANLLAKAINDVYANKKSSIDDKSIETIMMKTLMPEQYKKTGLNIEAGEKFLAQNKKKAGVITTSSGLQYEVITQGTGPKPSIADSVVCNYRGTFLNGIAFDDSYARGIPATFALTGVVKGWTEVLQLMPVGSKYKVYVPYQLGFGGNDYNGIPGGSLTIFDIELLGIKAK